MAGINIDIAANTRDFQRGTKDVESALDDVADALDDLAADSQRQAQKVGSSLGDGVKDGTRDVTRSLDAVEDDLKSLARTAQREGKDVGDDLGDGVKDGAKDADRALERTEKSFRELADTAKREDPGKPLGVSVRKGADDAKEGLGEFKDEANSTAREAAASFDGSAESIGDAFQEVAANAFAGFGPAGAAAGLLIAAGLGIGFAKINEGSEDTEEFRAKVSDLGKEFIATGKLGESSMEFVLDQLRELATTTDENVTGLGELRDAVEAAGQSSGFAKIAQAYAGSTDQLDKLVKQNEDYLEQLEEESQLAPQAATGAYEAAIKKAQGQQRVVEELTRAQEAAQQAADQEAAWLAAGGPEMERKAQLIASIDTAFDDAAGAANDYIVAETGLFDTQAYIDAMTARAEALAEYENTLATTSLTPEARAFIDSQGVESASTFLAGYKKATPAQQAELNRIWSEAGRTSSGSFASSVDAKLAAAGFRSDVRLIPNTSELDSAIEARKKQVITVGIKAAILPSGVPVP